MAQLGRVQTPTPRLLSLTNNADATATSHALRTLVQIRPTLLHYVQDGVLMCVIASQEEIVGVTQCDQPPATPTAAMPSAAQVVIATSSGSVWLLRLPTTPMGVKPLVLKAPADASPNSSHAAVRRIAEVPGVQQLVYLAGLDLLVCTSLLVPTTIVGGLLQASSAQWELEIGDLDDECSTSLCVVTAGSNRRLASWLLGETPGSPARILILQGDADGKVRCAVVDAGDRRAVDRVTEIAQMSEPIHSLVPVRVEKGTGADALLVVGSRGSVVLLSHGLTDAQIRFGTLGTPVTSVHFLDDGDESMIAFSTGGRKISILPMAQLLTQLHENTRASKSAPKPLVAYSAELSQSQDVLVFCSHASAKTELTLLIGSGRLISVDLGEAFQSAVLSNTKEANPTDLKVKALLQDIGQLSQKTDTLRETSERADALLYGVNTALQLVRQVEQYGIGTVVTCATRLKLVDNGWAMQSKGVRLLFALQFKDLLSPTEFKPQAMWRLQFTVGSSTNVAVASYGFPLHECIGKERCIQLDESVLQQRDGVVHVSCELVFNPRAADSKATSQLVSFGIPVFQAKPFHLVQLSEPTPDFPMNPAVVREKFIATGVSAPARQAHQWWPTLLEDAGAAGILLSTVDTDAMVQSASPPLRVVTRISRGRAVSEAGLPMTEQEALALVNRLMNADTGTEEERQRWRAACRHVNGKWWIGMRTSSGNLIVLRLAATTISSPRSETDSVAAVTDCVEITAHASNAPDLAAIRALLLHTRIQDALSSHENTWWRKQDLESASVALMNTRAELNTLAATISDIRQKTTSAAISGRRDDKQEVVDVCQDELLQLLQRTGQVETRTLEMYWKIREVLGQHLAL